MSMEETQEAEKRSCRRGISRSLVPDNPDINNLSSLLHDVYLRYIALIDEEFALHYRVFDVLTNLVHQNMKDVDPYYNRFSERVQCAGSHYDWLRIGKPDEFDVVVVIGLPLNIRKDPFDISANDIIFQTRGPGFVQLKTGYQFQNMSFNRETWPINITAYNWKDRKDYICSDKFIQWFEGVVHKGLNASLQNGMLDVDGVKYSIETSKGGPAITFHIWNNLGFKMDIDFVPALKFPENRWLGSKTTRKSRYQKIPPKCKAPQEMWMVVPKPNKDAHTEHDRRRSWRLAMQEQERGLMFDSNNMKLAIRYMKKLRDAMNMTEISSYFIKTLFFWEAFEHHKYSEYWDKDLAILFKIMVKKLHSAVQERKIPYFWNKKCNFIKDVNVNILMGYERKLAKLVEILDQPERYKEVAMYILTPSEFTEYNDTFLHLKL